MRKDMAKLREQRGGGATVATNFTDEREMAVGEQVGKKKEEMATLALNKERRCSRLRQLLHDCATQAAACPCERKRRARAAGVGEEAGRLLPVLFTVATETALSLSLIFSQFLKTT